LYRCALGLNAHIDIQDGGKGAIFCIAGKGATILVLITGGPRFHWHYTDIAYRSIGAIDHLKEKKIFLKFTSHRSLVWISHAGPLQGLKIRGGGLVVLGGDNVSPPLVKIGLTDLPKTGGLKPCQPPRLRRP
jgi:hypothetical protein